jgi:aspartate/methionine/tyrosine aminotransferase
LGWAVDIDGLKKAVSNKTKLIFVCNPNNPTGQIMSADEMEAVTNAADKVGAWVFADEVCCGTERVTDEVTPSFWGKHPFVLATNSMSKLYGIPGTRVGWVVAPNKIADKIWKQQDYMTISAPMIGNKVAAYALRPEVRSLLIARARNLIHLRYDIIDSWVKQHQDYFSLVPPQAMTNAFIRYHKSENSADLVSRLIKEKSTLVIPGEFMGADHHLRISFALPDDYLKEGLNRLHEFVSKSS